MQKPRPRRPLRAALLALGGGAGLLLLYLGATRTLLGTGILRSLVNTSPESTWIGYDEASSLWPGRLRVKNLRIRGRDQNVEWFLRLEDVRAEFSVRALLLRKFHVKSARGSGLSFRLRKLRKSSDPSPAPVALIPPIPGFPDPPLASPEPERPAGPLGLPWAVEVENLSIEPLEEIWIEVYRSRGRARVTGGFFLRPGLEASVGPAAIEFLSGDIRIGREPLLTSWTGRVACRIERYDPRQVQGDAVWGKTSGTVTLDGRIEAMRFVNYFLRGSTEPRLAGGAGTARIEGRVDRGVSKGEVRLAARGLQARTAETTLKGDTAVTLRIARWDLERGLLDLSGSRVELSDVALLSDGSRDWWGRFDLVAGSLDGALTTSLQAKCRDARPLFSLFATRLPKWTRGLLTLEGLDASARVTLAGPLVRVQGLDAKGGSFHIEGEYRRSAGERDGIFLIDAGRVNVGVAVRRGKASLRLIGARGWFEKARRAGPPFGDAGDQRARSTTTAVP
jgi:hypothetical protein